MLQLHSATARGAKHTRDGRPNQDACAILPLSGGTYAIAVADGHGSSEHGDIGARLAVEIATLRLGELWRGQQHEPDNERLRACATWLQTHTFASIVGAWRRCVEACLGVEPGRGRVDTRLLRPYGTTLLAALVGPTGAVVVQLGDGGIWQYDDSGLVQAQVESLEDAIGDTTVSLCSPQPEQHAVVRWWPREAGAGATTLMLATDGFQKSYANDAAAATFLFGVHDRKVHGGPDELDTKLPKWLDRMAREAAGDDTTMVLVHWPADAVASEVVADTVEIASMGVPAAWPEAADADVEPAVVDADAHDAGNAAGNAAENAAESANPYDDDADEFFGIATALEMDRLAATDVIPAGPMVVASLPMEEAMTETMTETMARATAGTMAETEGEKV